MDALVLRWLPTVPGYLLAIVGILSLVERRRLLAAGRGWPSRRRCSPRPAS